MGSALGRFDALASSFFFLALRFFLCLFVWATGVFALTLQAMSYVSSMRSNLALMARSPRVPSMLIDRVRSDFVSYLEKRVLIYPQSLLALGLRPDMTFQERKQALGLKSGGFSSSPAQQVLDDFLERSSVKARKQSWIWRIGSECENMRDLGWYPFFVTLTVDPSRCGDLETFWREGVEFRRYIHSLAKVSAAAAGYPSAIRDGASDHHFLRHVGVIEHGSSGDHHHMHLLVWFRAIPESWKVCPNATVNDPRSRVFRVCKPLSSYWKWSLAGLSPAMYFRFEGDIWSVLGHVVPVDRKNRKPLRIGSARSSGLYIAKYMEKGSRKWLHRVKATRSLGKDRILGLLHRMNVRQLEALTWRPRSFDLSVSLQMIHSVPSVLLRSMAKQVLFCKIWDTGCNVPQTWTAQSGGVYKLMCESVRDGIQPHRMSLKDFYDWVTGLLPVPSGYCEKRISRAHLQFKFDFPAANSRPVSHLGGV